MMYLIFAFIAHRALSGYRNGIIYREGERGEDVVSLVSIGMVIFLGLSGIIAGQHQRFDVLDKHTWAIIAAICAAVSVFCTLVIDLMPRNIIPDEYTDIHLFTFLEQTAFAGLLAVSGNTGLIAVCLSVYPAVVAQKICVNVTSGLKWNYHGTDDPTGKYYCMPLLGICIPRISFNLRLFLAAASILLAAYIQFETR